MGTPAELPSGRLLQRRQRLRLPSRGRVERCHTRPKRQWNNACYIAVDICCASTTFQEQIIGGGSCHRLFVVLYSVRLASHVEHNLGVRYPSYRIKARQEKEGMAERCIGRAPGMIESWMLSGFEVLDLVLIWSHIAFGRTARRRMWHGVALV